MNWFDRLHIMRENRAISQNGCYTAPDGKEVRLSAASLSDRTIFLPPDADRQFSAKNIRKTPFTIAENTVRADTVSCVLGLRETETGEIIALNFANANVPGGGYLLGGDAQEESLCRCSLLYSAIAPHKEYYRPHHFPPTPFYSDRMLLSPDVPIIRRMDGTLLQVPVSCTFLTCAAVNRRIAKLFFVSDKKINRIMERRIMGIVSAMAARSPAVIVLGAFGCGAFGNKRKNVYPMIEQAVNRFVPDEIRVVFASP